MERKKGDNRNRANHEKNCSETWSSMVRTGKFYVKLYMSIFTTENSHPAQVFLYENLNVKLSKNLVYFLLKLHSHCCKIVKIRLGFNIKTTSKQKAKNFTKHERETSLMHALFRYSNKVITISLY